MLAWVFISIIPDLRKKRIKMSRIPTSNAAAFSLLELLLTLFLIALLAELSLPRLTVWLDAQQGRFVREQLLQCLHFASREALVRHLPVIFCARASANACGLNWSNGQLLFIDSEFDGKIHRDQQRLQTRAALAKDQTLFYRGYPRYHTALYFYPQNRIRNDNGSFWFCQQKRIQWAVRVNQMGNLQIVTPNAEGDIFDSEGKVLTC